MSPAATYGGLKQEYYFPLPKPGSHTRSASGSAVGAEHRYSSHSRQYTVCLGEPLRLPDKASSMSKLAAPPILHEPKNSSGGLSVSSSPRKHAHRRSGAISHDFSAELRMADKETKDSTKDSTKDFTKELPGNNPIKDSSKDLIKDSPKGSPNFGTLNNSGHALPLPVTPTTASVSDSVPDSVTDSVTDSMTSLSARSFTTFTSSSSSLPSDRTPELRVTDYTSFEGAKSQPGQQHIEHKSGSGEKILAGAKLETLQKTDKESGSTSSLSSDVSNATKPVSRHKKVKSWASSLRNFTRASSHSRKSSMDNSSLDKETAVVKQDSESSQLSPSHSPSSKTNSVFSSSYVSADLLHSPTKTSPLILKAPEPVIDLDLALAPTSSSNHRRCDSAPESMLLAGKQQHRYNMLEEAVPEVDEEEEDSESGFSSPQPRYGLLGSPYKNGSGSNNGSSVSVNSANSYERRSRYSRHSPRLSNSNLNQNSTPNSNGSQVRSLSAVTGNELKKKHSHSLMPPPPTTTSLKQNQTIIAVNNDLKYMIAGSQRPAATSASLDEPVKIDKVDQVDEDQPNMNMELRTKSPPVSTNQSSEYIDTFYLGGPGFVRYSMDSDRVSYYTVDSKAASSVNSAVPSEIPAVPSPSSLHSPTLTSANVGVYANKTQPVVGSRPVHKDGHQPRSQQNRNSTLSIKSSVSDTRSIMSGSNFKKGANRVYDWFKHKSFA